MVSKAVDTKTLVSLARKFSKAVESAILETKTTAPFTIGFHSLEQDEIDKFLELQSDQYFYENYNIVIALAGDSDGISPGVTARLKRLEKSKDTRALRLGDAFAKIVLNAEETAGHKLVRLQTDAAQAISDQYALAGCRNLSKIFAPE